MRDVLLVLLVFGSLPIILMRPYVGIVFWVWITYMVPHKLAFGFAVNFPFAQAVAVATLVGWILSKERKTVPINAMTFLLFLFTVWISLTTVFAVLPDTAFTKWEKVMKVFIMAFVSIPLLTTRKRIELIVWTIALSIGFYGVKGGLFLIRGGGTTYYTSPKGGFYQDNNAFALVLVMSIPLMRYLQLQAKQIWLRLGLGAAMLLSMMTAAGTYSRGGFLAMAMMAATMVLMSRRRVIFGVVLIAAGFAGAAFVPETWVARMETIQNYEEDASARGRFNAWAFAWRYAQDHPILGGGFLINRADDLFLEYVPEAAQSRAFHSIYFELMGEHGFAGLGIYLAIMLTAALYTNSTRAAIKGNKDLQWAGDLMRMTLVSMVGYAVGGLFLNVAFQDFYYHLVVLILCTKLYVDAELKTAKQRRPESASSAHLAVPRHE